MNLTLYANCRLTKEYNEVIQGSYLEAYLNSLTKTTLSIDDVYLTRSGTFNIDLLSSGAFQYNYFKLEDTTNSITRYFFIDDIDIVNGTCVISYTEDIWSSYSSYINIIKGNIENLRFGISTNPKFLPDHYNSNNVLTLTPLGTTASSFTEFQVIVELSYYKPVGSGEIVDRHFMTAKVTGLDTLHPTHSFDGATGYAEQILEWMALGKNLKVPNDSTFYNYDVTNIYIVPKPYANSITYNSSVYVNLSKAQDDTTLAYKFATLCLIQYGEHNLSYSVDNDFKRYAIGTLDNLIPVENNGSSIEVNIKMSVDNIKFTMYLRVGTSIIDITNSFAYELPISIQSADITQQQAIARQVKNLSLDIAKQEIRTKGAINIVSSMAQTGIGLGTAVATGGAMGVGSVVGGLSSTATVVADTIFSLKENDLNRWQNNVQAYTTSTAVKVNKDIYLNCYYGIVHAYCVPDNNTYINNLIDVVGYRTNMIVSNNTLLTTAQESQTYNIIKFSSLMMYGNIPHSIQAELKAILMKGIKIYFTNAI